MIYYWETSHRCGQFEAQNDSEALQRLPNGCWVLYKESDTDDGLPFIIIHERNVNEPQCH